MTASATTAPTPESIELLQPNRIQDRLEEWREKHPRAKEYRVTNELNAAEILILGAATLKCAYDICNDPDQVKVLKTYAEEYRAACFQGKALRLISSMTAENQLEIIGLKIRAGYNH